MGKAGSTSIQAWLAENAARLRGLETCLLVLRESDERTGARPRLTPYASGNANSNLIRMALTPGGGEDEAYLDSFFEQLGAAATRSRVVVLSAERMSEFFFRALPPSSAAWTSLEAGTGSASPTTFVRSTPTLSVLRFRLVGIRLLRDLPLHL